METKFLALKENEDLEFWFTTTTQLNENQQFQLFKYYNLIVQKNKVMNLAGSDTLQGVYLKHFYDALTLYSTLNIDTIKTIADIGSGAGFPGIILAIVFPNKKITLIEPMKKRCNFLEEVVEKLGLVNVEILNQRAEEIKTKYDVAISRAVAKLNILLELSIPIVKVEGWFIAMKGPNYQEEIFESQKALYELDAKVLKIHTCILPIENSNRANIIIKKTKETNAIYPRNYGVIKKNPL